MSDLSILSLPVAPLPWQGKQWSRVRTLASAGRLPHALLITGERGVGKLQFSMALAQSLLCEQPRDGLACGQCRQCGFLRAGSHPDLRVVTLEDKSRQIKVEQVREVVEFLGHTAQQGGYKITVIHPAETMNINAANALLKCLEEPSGKSLLVLVTGSPGRLMATIRSRCQALPISLPGRTQALEWLSTVVTSPEEASALLDLARGRPLTALQYFSSDAPQQMRRIEGEFLALLEGRVGAVALANQWQDLELTDILEWLSLRLRQILGAMLAARSPVDGWQNVLQFTDPRALFDLADRVTLLANQLAGGANPNRQLALETLLLAACDKIHSGRRG